MRMRTAVPTAQQSIKNREKETFELPFLQKKTTDKYLNYFRSY